MSVSSAMIAVPVFVSRLPVGSSARISGGSIINALATATRCIWPPDNSDGRCSARSASSDQCKQVQRTRLDLRHPCAVEQLWHRNVFPGRHRRKQIEELEDESHTVSTEFGLLLVVECSDFLASEPD